MKICVNHAKIFSVLSVVLLLFCVSCKKDSRDVSESAVTKSSNLLKQIGDEYWEYLLEEALYYRIKFGLKIEKLPDLSFSYAETQSRYAASLLERLKDVKENEISHEEWITLEILKWELNNYIEGFKFFWLGIPVTPYTSPLPTVNRAFLTYQFEEKSDINNYLELLKKYPPFIKNMLDILQEQYKKNIILPKEEINLVLGFLNSLAKKGEQSQLYVERDRLSAFENDVQEEVHQKLVEKIDLEVNPALKELIQYIGSEYLAKAPADVGLWQYPNGLEYYRYLIKVHTTMDITPEEIHELGLEHVEKDNIQVDEIREKLGFEGTLAEFKQFLKTDSRFFPKTPDEIGEKLRSYMDGMSRKIDEYFLKKPKTPYDVRRLAPELEGSMTFGYYQAPSKSEPTGIYLYNGSNLSERSLLWAAGLLYHELVPGHHFHLASQSENQSLPPFRRETSHGAYTEGWAEYASWLGVEMGLFEDLYDLCGKHMMDVFLSTRLVVDTGMNFFKWPKSKAVEFMRENLIESETQIHSETLRYSVDMPGQALSYKLGSIKMMELRQKVEKALGNRFDIRKYHDAILGSGSMPFPVLDKHIDWFIEKELNTK